MSNAASRLAYFMESRQMTQSHLAQKLGVSRATISHWLTGHIAMPQIAAMALQVVFGVRWEWIMNGSGPEQVDQDAAADQAVFEFRKILRTLPEAQWNRIVANVRAMAELINSMQGEKPVKSVKQGKAKR